MARHRLLKPECPFVKNPMQSGNVPILGTPSLHTRPRSEPAHPTPAAFYRSEAERLMSFRNWPIPHIIAPERLARIGFYYFQESDKVKCAFCSGIVGHWEVGDDPEEEHQRHFPSCPIHFNIPVGNFPLEARQELSVKPQETSRHESLCELQKLPTQVPGGSSSCKPGLSDKNVNKLGIQSDCGPRHPKFSTLESRLRTYTSWPSNLQQTPQQLAQAGFYYAGTNDQVRCFHCDGGHRSWDPSDDPWTEHARWFPNCAHVLLIKGEEYVAQAMVEHPPVLKPTDNVVPTSCIVQNVRGVTESVTTAGEGGSLSQASLNEETRDAMPSSGINTSQSMPSLAPYEDVCHSEQTMNKQLGETNAQSLPHLPSMNKKFVGRGSPVPLEEENRHLREARLCKICMDEEVGVVFLPCGHLVTCVRCAPCLKDCPMCRQQIKDTLQTFLS